MIATIFLGPSLPLDAARAVLDADYRPPVAQGDVYRAVRDGARVIGIADGFFERVPAVWHKEILWALTQGVHVFGAASMGALRAAELAAYGMTGVGEVFDAFHGGRLDDDDEVAIVHGPAELGYPALSEAMVNIRATLDRAAAEAVIGRPLRDRLTAIAKSLYFPERHYDRILDRAAAHDLAEGPAAELEALRAWLPTGRLDVKRSDALAMLHAIAALQARDPGPRAASFVFTHTDTWERMVRRMEPATGAGNAAQEDLLEELRLDPDAHQRAINAAMARALALREADRLGVPADSERFGEALNGYFVQRGLLAAPAIQGWMADQELDAKGLTALIQREERIGVVETLNRSEIRNALPDILRGFGRFGALSRRVREKRRWLAENGLDGAGLAATGLGEAELVSWHFTGRLGLPVPAHLDSHIRALGLDNRQAFIQALARDYLFTTRRDAQAAGSDDTSLAR